MTGREGRVSATTLRAARNAAFAAGSDVLGKVATLAWTVLAARLLGQGDFGAFFYALTVGLLLSAVAEWGFPAVMVQRSTADLKALPALFTQAITWQVAVAVPLFAAGGALAALGRPSSSARLTLALVLAAVLVDLWSSSARAASAAAQDQRGTASALVVQRAATAVLVVGALWAGGGVVAMSAAFLAGSVLGVLAHARAVHRLGVRFSRRHLTRPALRDLLGRTWLLGLTSVALVALFRVDAVLLGALTGDDEVGAYAAAYRLLETVLFVAFAVRSAVFPVMNVPDQPEIAARGAETGLASVALVYLPFAVVCLTETSAVLGLLYGPPYDDVSRDALRLLAPAPMVYAAAYFTSAALQARLRFRSMLHAALLAFLVNVVLNLALIPAYGGAGAAAATTASYVLAAGYGVVVLRRAGVPVRVLRPLAEPAAACLVLAPLLVLSPLPLLVEVGLGAVVYLVVWALLARRTSPEHLLVVQGLLRRRRQGRE